MFIRSEYNTDSEEPKFNIEKNLQKRKEFSNSEVGLTHQDNPSFIRLNDSGDIEIFAAPGVGIVINGQARSISFFADTIKFFTREDGLRWNNFNFNYASSDFIEPTLTKIDMNKIHEAMNNVDHYLGRIKDIEKEQEQKPITISGDSGFRYLEERISQSTSEMIDTSRLSVDQVELLASQSQGRSMDNIKMIAEYMSNGYSFAEASQKAGGIDE
jgi:hypothetical protein